MKKNRVPKSFFITKGSGCDEHAYHAGAYHFALYDAGIAEFNLVGYSSVLPATAELVTIDEIDLPVYGSEMCCIKAEASGGYGDTICAGIIYAWLYKDEEFEKKYGGLVAELTGHSNMSILEERLRVIIDNSFKHTFKKKGLYMGEPEVYLEELNVIKRYGSAVVAMCFLDYD